MRPLSGQPPIDSSPPRVEREQGRGVDSIRGQKKLPVGVAKRVIREFGLVDDIVVSARPTVGRPIHVTLGGNPNQFWLGENRGELRLLESPGR